MLSAGHSNFVFIGEVMCDYYCHLGGNILGSLQTQNLSVRPITSVRKYPIGKYVL